MESKFFPTDPSQHTSSISRKWKKIAIIVVCVFSILYIFLSTTLLLDNEERLTIPTDDKSILNTDLIIPHDKDDIVVDTGSKSNSNSNINSNSNDNSNSSSSSEQIELPYWWDENKKEKRVGELMGSKRRTLFILGNHGRDGQAKFWGERLFQCGDNPDEDVTEWTVNRTRIKDANGAIYFNEDIDDWSLWGTKAKSQFFNGLAQHQLKILVNFEPPGENSRCEYEPTCITKFNATMGTQPFNDIIMAPISKFLLGNITYGREFNYQRDILDFKTEKDVMVSWMGSVCDGQNQARSRTKFVAALMNHTRVDSYGRCLRNKKIPVGGDRSEGTWGIYKQNTIAKYKFYLALENSFCPGYISEKPYHALMSGTVPIVGGDQEGHSYLPPGSYISLTQFQTLSEMVQFLETMTDSEYRSYFKWREYDPDKEPYREIQYQNWLAKHAATNVTELPCTFHRYYTSRLLDKFVNPPPRPFVDYRPTCVDRYKVIYDREVEYTPKPVTPQDN